MKILNFINLKFTKEKKRKTQKETYRQTEKGRGKIKNFFY